MDQWPSLFLKNTFTRKKKKKTRSDTKSWGVGGQGSKRVKEPRYDLLANWASITKVGSETKLVLNKCNKLQLWQMFRWQQVCCRRGVYWSKGQEPSIHLLVQFLVNYSLFSYAYWYTYLIFQWMGWKVFISCEQTFKTKKILASSVNAIKSLKSRLLPINLDKLHYKTSY